jgi:hypothetical protein
MASLLEMQSEFELAASQQQSLEERKKLKSGSGYIDYSSIVWLGLEEDKEALFRIMGSPAEVRKAPWHPKIIYVAQALRDDGKAMGKIIFPQKTITIDTPNGPFVRETGELDGSWWFLQMLEAITKQKWVKYPNGQKDEMGKEGHYVYVHSGAISLQRIENNKLKGWTKPTKFYPTRRVVLPVIDRLDSWCEKEKHTKLLSSKVNIEEKEVDGKTVVNTYADWGIGITAYQVLFKHAKKWRGHWDIDYVCTKTKTGQNYDYDFRDVGENIPEALKTLARKEPMTQEEAAQYKHYNLDEIFRPSSARYLLKYYGNLISQIDIDLKTTYSQLAIEKARLEEEEAEARKANEAKTFHPITEKPEDEPSTNTPVTADNSAQKTDSAVAARRKVAASTPSITVAEQVLKYPFGNKLTPQDIAALEMAVERVENQRLIFKAGETLLACTETCKWPDGTPTALPSSVLHCPMCGAEYES